MNTKLIFGGAILIAAAISAGSMLVQATESNELTAPPVVPANPAVELPVQLVHVQPFELAEPAVHSWRLDGASYTTGLLVVLEADPAFLVPRQTAEPVLFVGNQTVARVNTGYPSGQLVGIVPGMTLEELADAPIFFGQPALPESVGAAHIAAELDAARASGLTGPGAERVAIASADGPIGALDLSDLRFQASFLIEKYSPTEVDLVSGLRAPRVEFK
jgi:hypothetical protein